MRSMWVLALLAQLVTVCLAQTEDAALTGSLALVTKECNLKLTQINSLESFDEFMKHFRGVINGISKPKKGLLNRSNGLRRCYDEAEQLLRLDELIKHQDGGVCRQSYIDKLVDFHYQYVVKKSSESTNEDSPAETNDASNSSGIRTKYTARIFSLLAHQVTHTCKSRLLDRVNSVQSVQDCTSVLGSFLPANILKGADETSSDLELDDFTNFLRDFKRVEDFAIMGKQSNSVGPYFDVVVSQDVIERINSLKIQCRAREPYYSALFAPIATLSQLGYDVQESSVDSQADDLVAPQAKLLKCWLATAQLCQGVLRTHVTQDSSQGDNDEAEDDKLVKIKFGQVPEDVSDGEAVPPSDLPDFVDSVQQISPTIVQLVDKKASLKGKIKRKALNWAKQFIERHIDIDSRREEMAQAFMKALTREETEVDSSVALNGKKRNHGVYRPATLITDDADSITSTVSMFVHKEIAIILSSAVAICLSAVFVWFTLYALVSSMRASSVPESGDNFKANWRQLRDKRMKALDDKVKRKGWKDKLVVYRSATS